MDDRELLSRYFADASEEAFAELVRRNAGLVYSAARRQLNDADMAEDVTQAVFTLLVRKGRSIKGSVAGWLVLATWYTCRDARRLAARREYHERRAGAMRADQQQDSPSTSWESYSPKVDAAMARLSRRERDIIALRYLRGMQLNEAAVCLGISEEAARKRAQRALVRLRRLIASSGAVPAEGVLAEQLAAHGAGSAPVKLVEWIIASPVAKAGFAAMLAQKAGASILAMKAKVAAMIVLSLAMVGTAAAVVIVAVQGSSNPPPTVPPPTAAAPVIAVSQASVVQVVLEVQVPGEIQLARWEVVLDDPGAKALTDVLHPIKTDSKFFQAYHANGQELRSKLDAIKGQVKFLNFPKSLDLSTEPNASFSLSMSRWLDEQYSQIVYSGRGGAGVFGRRANNRLHLKLGYGPVKLVPMANNWQLAKPTDGSIFYEGDLIAGDAVAFLGDYAGTNRKNFHHLLVYETFNARPEEMTYFQQNDSAWWCARGPAQLRAWADAALAWKAKVPRSATAAPGFQKQLEDGNTLRLVGLCQNSRGPFCWWDPSGNPVDVQQQIVPLDGNPSGNLIAAVELIGSEPKLQPGKTSATTQPADEWAGVPVRNGRVELSVLVGPWEETARLQVGKSLMQGGVRYQIDNAIRILNDTGSNFRVRVRGLGDHGDFISAIDCDGNEHFAENSSMPQLIGWRSGMLRDQYYLPVFRDLPVDRLKYFRLLQRKMQWVTIANVATEPNQALPGGKYLGN